MTTICFLEKSWNKINSLQNLFPSVWTNLIHFCVNPLAEFRSYFSYCSFFYLYWELWKYASSLYSTLLSNFYQSHQFIFINLDSEEWCFRLGIFKWLLRKPELTAMVKHDDHAMAWYVHGYSYLPWYDHGKIKSWSSWNIAWSWHGHPGK